MPSSAKTILIAPLDWGLGHTTRCIPVIRVLEGLGHQVRFAGNERQTAFIRKSFPEMICHPLEGYEVRYSRRLLFLTLLWQVPRLLRVIRREYRWLRQLVAEEAIDGIISDNRYGLWHPEVPSVILTHQPAIHTGLGALADTMARKVHYRFLNRFGGVWIPDIPGGKGLGGSLSHPPDLPPAASYVGWLSQFQPAVNAGAGRRILILLSGPEPQRTLLADALWVQAADLQQPVVFVEGSANAARENVPAHIRHIPLAGADELQTLLEDAELVVCRSGYSTLMDLALLRKKAALIPTPGQAEQEYLAALGYWPAFAQKGFSLHAAISAARDAPPPPFANDGHELLLPVLQVWLEYL